MTVTQKYLCLLAASAALAILPSNHLWGLTYENWSLGWPFLDAGLLHDHSGWHFDIGWKAYFINIAIWMLVGIVLWAIIEKIHQWPLRKYLSLFFISAVLSILPSGHAESVAGENCQLLGWPLRAVALMHGNAGWNFDRSWTAYFINILIWMLIGTVILRIYEAINKK